MVTVLGIIGAVNTRGFVPGGFESDIELAGAGAECPVVKLQDYILEVKPMILEHPVFELFCRRNRFQYRVGENRPVGRKLTVTSGPIVV